MQGERKGCCWDQPPPMCPPLLPEAASMIVQSSPPCLTVTSPDKRKIQLGLQFLIPLNFAYRIEKLWSGSEHKAGSRTLPPVFSMDHMPRSLQDNANTVNSNTDWTNAKPTGGARGSLWNKPALDTNWSSRLLRREKNPRNDFKVNKA